MENFSGHNATEYLKDILPTVSKYLLITFIFYSLKTQLVKIIYFCAL